MNDVLTPPVFGFLKRHHDKARPLLLAFSGGPDSLALLHVLLAYRKAYPLSLALAHVDHGWRSESAHEAESIAKMGKELAVEVHIKRLQPDAMKGNLEAACRQERLEFFAALCQAHGYQAVLFGHHADDLAETVLKRTLEGVALPYLCGIRGETEMLGMKLWRPLLSVPKKAILAWLEAHELKGLQDSTNEDTRFLRARFRQNIIPQLSQEFGKQVCQSLCHIAMEAAELRGYLDKQLAPYLTGISRNKLGSWLDLSTDLPASSFELKHLLRRCCDLEGFALSRDALEKTAVLLNSGAADKQIMAAGKCIFIDRRRLFITTQMQPSLPAQGKVICAEETFSYGAWRVSVSNEDVISAKGNSGWQSLWQAGMEVVLPPGSYELAPPQLNTPYPRSQPLSKWWTEHKVPAFLRLLIPVVYQQGRMVHEFLTGKSPMPPIENSRPGTRIHLKIS